MTTIMLADDHPIVRKGLRAVLEAEADYEVVGEAEDGQTALQMVERLKPDILLVDIMMPGLGGLEVTRQCASRAPRTKVIVLSVYANEPYVLEALRNGASAYVLKTSDTNSLLTALREVEAGHRYLSPPLSERAIHAYISQTSRSVDVFDPYETLTNREREVLQLAVEGHSNTEIGERLSISPRTAETHRTNLMRKLGLSGQTELLKFAVQKGLLNID